MKISRIMKLFRKKKKEKKYDDLVSLIEDKQWDAVVERLKTTRGVNEARNSINIELLYPIQMVCCESDTPLYILNALLEAYPEGVRETGLAGASSIQLAALKSCSEEIVISLIEVCPEGLQHRDIQGMLPLHWAASNCASVNVLNIIIKSYPEGLQQPDEDGNLPIHTAAQNNCTVEIIQRLIEAYPEGQQQQNSNGKTPKDVALSEKRPQDIIACFD